MLKSLPPVIHTTFLLDHRSFFRRHLTKRKVTILELHFDSLTEANVDDCNEIR